VLDRVPEMHKWADKIKAIQDERIGLAIVAANNHYAGFGPGSERIKEYVARKTARRKVSSA